MKRVLVLLAALLIASVAGGAVRDLNVTGNSILGTNAANTVTVNATLSMQAATSFPAGTAALPSINFTGSLTTGFYEVAADSPGVSVATANVGTWDAAGYQGDLGQTTPGAADVTTLTTTGVTDLAAGTAALPSVTFTGSATTGFYEVAADSPGVSVATANVTTWDGTGLIATGINGPIGTVTPAAGTFTDVDVGGTFNFGQDPADLTTGFRDISNYITFTETFDEGSNAGLAVKWDITQVVGAGTNDATTLDGWNTLITGGAGGPDMESTRTNGLNHNAAYAPRIECVVDLGAVAAGQTFFFGFWAAATRYAQIIHEPATSANWLLRVDDTAGAETIDSGVAATLNPTKLAIWVTTGGVVDWAIDDVDMATAGLTNLMANDHYVEWRILDVAAAAHTVYVDYFISEQLKQQ